MTKATGKASINVKSTDASGFAGLDLTAATVSATLQLSSVAATLRTTSAHVLRFQANSGASSIFAMSISTNNNCNFGNSIIVAGTSTFNGNVTFADGSTNASDQSIKTVPQDASVDDSLAMLRSLSARTYQRTDLSDTSTRLGFIAQEVAASLPAAGTFANIVGSMQYAPAEGDEPREILTVDYARLSAVLWQCCKRLDSDVTSLLQRVEALEAAAP